MTSIDISSLRTSLRLAAREELLGRFVASGIGYKADGSLVTAADFAMNSRIRTELGHLYPDTAFLSEEMSPEEQLRALESVDQDLWVLDPLDGTSNYVNGLPYFCVSLALIRNGQVLYGLVYDPNRDECFDARLGEGAWLNGQPLGRGPQVLSLGQSIALVDFKRLPPALASRLAATPPYASQRSLGSVALDFCWLAAGRVHLYLHGRHNLWDYAAGRLILQQAGGYCLDLEGRVDPPLSLDPRSSVAALEAGLFRQWCAWLGITPPSAVRRDSNE